jgi:hypothetical protein
MRGQTYLFEKRLDNGVLLPELRHEILSFADKNPRP